MKANEGGITEIGFQQAKKANFESKMALEDCSNKSKTVRRDLLVFDNKYELGEENIKENGEIDHKSLTIKKLFGLKPSESIKQKEKPNFGVVEKSSSRIPSSQSWPRRKIF